MRLLSVYAPPTFTRPVLIVSTTVHYDDIKGIIDECETAIATVNALNNNNALNLFDFKSGEWKRIKLHKTKDKACEYHIALAKKLSWDYENHYDTYGEILALPEVMKKILE